MNSIYFVFVVFYKPISTQKSVYSLICDVKKYEEETNKKFDVDEVLKEIQVEDFNLSDVINAGYQVDEYTGYRGDYTNFFLSNALSKVIEYNYELKKWIVVNKLEPDYKLLELSEKTTLKIFLVGEEFNDVIKNNNKRQSLISLFKNSYYVEPELCPLLSKQHSDLVKLSETLPDNYDNNFIILLSDNTPIKLIHEIADIFDKRKSTTVMVNSFVNNEYFTVMKHLASYEFKRVVIK